MIKFDYIIGLIICVSLIIGSFMITEESITRFFTIGLSYLIGQVIFLRWDLEEFKGERK